MKIADIPLDLPSQPKRRAAAEANAASSRSIEDQFQAIVADHADTVALVGGGQTLSFSQLEQLSRGIADFIRARRYDAPPVVGVLCRRSALYLAAALGIWRGGGVYLPVERDMPTARQEAMLKPAVLIVTDSADLDAAEYLLYRNATTRHILCLDSDGCDDAFQRDKGRSSIAYWEQLAEPGSDRGWRNDIDGSPLPVATLEAMAKAVVETLGLGSGHGKSILDIGSGSGTLARTLSQAAGSYTAFELARNEIDRLADLSTSAKIKVLPLEATDLEFLEHDDFDAIVMNGVVENFPGYTYLRRALDAAVARLAECGTLYLGAVRDLDARDRLREQVEEHARRSGDRSALLDLDAAAEMFVPRRLFTDWAAQSAVAVELSFRPTLAGNPAFADSRFDVTIRKGGRGATAAEPWRFGADAIPQARSQASACLPPLAPEQLAYIVYTSGSTGRPKGVMEEHRHLLHILAALKGFSDDCAQVALVAPLSFDASIQQIAVSLFCGKTLHILSDEQRKRPEAFQDYVTRERIDLADMTPAFFNLLVDHLHETHGRLPIKRILLAGEVLRPDMVRKFYATPGHEHVVLFNVYGPTECTVDSSAFRIDHANHQAFAAYPIGAPLDGVTISVHDRNGQPLPDSVTGELWISGAGVSRGYLNGENPESFVRINGVPAYRSGDQGFTQNGLVYYRGRDDQQVKIRGNRVEIAEVEKAIAAFPGVRQVTVVAGQFRTGEDKSLAAYVVGDVGIDTLATHLAQRLPSYCVPDYFVPMVELPLSANRKVDKKALPSPLGGRAAAAAGGRPPESALEQALAALWTRLLGVAVNDATASFFTLGGHSILAIRLVALIEKEIGVHLSLPDLFQNPSIADLAEVLQGKTVKQDGPVIELCRHEGGRSIFLFHPVGGSVFCYSDLARLLGQHCSVYAVESPGFSTERNAVSSEHYRVETLADDYLEEIVKVARGDVIFAGWSFGGLLAYEAALRYQALGHAPNPVLILDTVADNRNARQLAAKDDAELLKTLLKATFALDEDVLRALSREERMDYLLRCGEATGVLPTGFNAVQMGNLVQIYRRNTVAAARYEKRERSSNKILFVRATDFTNNPSIVPDDLWQGWARFVDPANICLKWTEGTHETILSPGLVGQVADHILNYLRQEGLL